MTKYDFTGMRFGRLTVIGRDKENTNKHDIYWICQCDCGGKKSVTTGHLNSGTVRSCGCIKREIANKQLPKMIQNNTVHGEAGNHLYAIWEAMKQRCKNPRLSAYKYYGGKGVKVCEEWNDFLSFSKWAYENGYQDIKNAPRKQRMSIDRIDSNGNYCPENCRWITVSENTRMGAKSRWDKAQNLESE